MKKFKPGKKLFSIYEIYIIAVKAFRSIKFLKRGKKAGIFDDKFQERIMLAVTNVNKCAMCSYAHTEMALKAGLAQEEINAFVEGDFPDIPDEQVKAVLFGQHYADMRGKPKRAMWEEILKVYGKDLSYCILAAIRIMMFGNAIGIVIGSIRSRFKGKKGDPRSNVFYEIMFVLLLIPILLISPLQALLMDLFGMPVISKFTPEDVS